MSDDRVYRAVPLHADEAAYLTREAGNRVSKPCCPHLDVFHTRGRTIYNGEWRTCNFLHCGCRSEQPSGKEQVERHQREVAEAWREEAKVHFTWFAVGAFLATFIVLLLERVS